jgi:hypothetical protein
MNLSWNKIIRGFIDNVTLKTIKNPNKTGGFMMFGFFCYRYYRCWFLLGFSGGGSIARLWFRLKEKNLIFLSRITAA